MKKILFVLISIILSSSLAACNNDSITDDFENEGVNGATIIDAFIDYDSKIELPKTTGQYKYYSYGYHWSTVTVSDYTYDISEQSESEIRIDFDFNCTFDYLGENTAGESFNFYIKVYDKNGVLIKESIVNETHAKVGDTVTTEHTILIDKEDVNNGVVIEFSGNEE